MARDGVGQARAQHHEMMLALAFRSAHRAAHRIIKPAKLALGSRIHIAAHAHHHGMRLIIEIQTVVDQLLDVDIGEAAVEGPAAAGAVATVFATAKVPSAFARTISTGPVSAAAFTGRTIGTTLAFFAAATRGSRRPIFTPRRTVATRFLPGRVRG